MKKRAPILVMPTPHTYIHKRYISSFLYTEYGCDWKKLPKILFSWFLFEKKLPNILDIIILLLLKYATCQFIVSITVLLCVQVF